MTTYGGGLRVSEVVRLQVSDIDAGRGMLRVEQGKGRKDRYTLLGPRLLAELRRYWQLYRPTAAVALPPANQARADAHRDGATDVLRGQGAGGHYQSGRHSRLAPCVYDPLIGRGRGSGDPATLAGPRECDDDHALRAPRAASSDRARVTAGELTGRGGSGVTDAAAVVTSDSARRCSLIRRRRPLKSPTSCGRMARRFGPRIPSRTSKRGSYGRLRSVARQRWAAMSNNV